MRGLANGPAAEASEVVFLTVPFRNQSETLTNLKNHLREGQLLVDATVPLAAAVSGKATRTLGVWQGSAAQQAQEMVPPGVRVVAALHTVNAPGLKDLNATLDEDVLICGDKKADKQRVAELIELIPGLQSRERRPARGGADRRDADRAADRRQRPLQDPRGHPAHRAARRAVVVLLAGGTGGAKLARGMLDVLGDELTVIANTGDDIEIYGSHVSPDPDLVTFWLADRIDERGWGIRDDTFHVMDGLRELGEDIWFNLGDRDLALCLRRARRLAEGRAADRGDRRAATRAERQGASAADVRRPGPHLRAERGRLARLPGVHDPRTGQGPRDGRRVSRARRTRASRRRCATRCRRPT